MLVKGHQIWGAFSGEKRKLQTIWQYALRLGLIVVILDGTSVNSANGQTSCAIAFDSLTYCIRLDDLVYG